MPVKKLHIFIPNKLNYEHFELEFWDSKVGMHIMFAIALWNFYIVH